MLIGHGQSTGARLDLAESHSEYLQNSFAATPQMNVSPVKSPEAKANSNKRLMGAR